MHMGHGRYGQFEKHVTVPGQSTWSSRSLELATCCSWIAPASDEKTFDVTAKPKRLWLQMSGHQESHIKFVWTLAPFEATASALDSAWVSRLKPWVRTQSTRNIIEKSTGGAKLAWVESKAEATVVLKRTYVWPLVAVPSNIIIYFTRGRSRRRAENWESYDN